MIETSIVQGLEVVMLLSEIEQGIVSWLFAQEKHITANSTVWLPPLTRRELIIAIENICEKNT
jgi:hypothetical protein